MNLRNLFCSQTQRALVRGGYLEGKLSFTGKCFLTNEVKPFKVGIIGAGPSALYCCKHLLKHERVKVDIFEKLPNPYGLIRYGVAPDHINVKNTYRTFDLVFLSANYRFFGNVHVGVDVRMEELRDHYNCVIFCCGASEVSLPFVQKDEDNTLRGEETQQGKQSGLFHARDLIYFYNNMYNDMRCRAVDNYLNSFENFTTSVIIGNGNVSLDIARILIKSPDDLNKTDISSDYLRVIKRHKIKHIYIVGQLRELISLENTKVILSKKNYDLCCLLKSDEANTNMKKRQHEIFQKMVKNYEEVEKNKEFYKTHKIIEFIFYFEIKKIRPIDSAMKNVEFELNKNIPMSYSSYEEKKVMVTPLVIFATGFKKSSFTENLYNQSIQTFREDIGQHKFGIFKAGWFDKGPKGNIASQILNSKNSTHLVLNFLQKVDTFFDNDISILLQEKQIPYVSFDDWTYLHQLEKQMGAQQNKIGQKFSQTGEVLRVLKDRTGKSH
ncbi:adrenodoxin reductase [Plasmodium cynomolgi strain B]|uniref:Adrenodoxin reductase n=1 Tax=Plasmodium cynomolgi (strain B) TaxID=1120755 RepID=K6UTM9_PLACD|nr:adrenodoxin reductase [Plasmodium cynomolgi strain B]GAB66669.1 adrenodoxin reductase [Plasmodium cynomolgi strain B]